MMPDFDASGNSVQLDCSVDSGICLEVTQEDLKKKLQEFKRILFILERDKEARRLLRERLSRIAERNTINKKKKNEQFCNVCFAPIDTEDSKTCIACCSCANYVCRGGEKCSELVPKDGEWKCRLCSQKTDSYGKTSTWVEEQYSVKRATPAYAYPMRARSEIYIPLCDPNDSAFLCNFESVSEAPSTINANQKQQIREYIEEVLAEMLGGSLDSTSVGQISRSENYLKLFKKFHESLSRHFLVLEHYLFPTFRDIPIGNEHELQGISHVRLRRLIESIIAETVRLPAFLQSDTTTAPAADPEHLETLTLNGNHCNGNAGQYFEPKKYQDLLATAVLNKIVDTHGNERLTESSPDLTSSAFDKNHNALFPNKTDDSISSSSSIEPRSESSLTDPLHNINKSDDISPIGSYGNFYADVANDNIEADNESVLSDFLASHMVPLPHISAEPASEEEEDDEDFISVASSGRDATWEDNWLFKKKRSGKMASSIGMLVPAPKEDIRALIGDKPTDEVSDLSEVGSDTDDSSLEMVSASLEPLNDRLVNQHLIGGKNTKVILDELVEQSSLISTSSLPENVPPYTETKNDYVVSNDGLSDAETSKISVASCNAAISHEAINSNVSKPAPNDSPVKAGVPSKESVEESVVPPPSDFTDDEKMRNLMAKFKEEQNGKVDSGDESSSSPRSSISCALSATIDRAELDAHEGITDFCVEDGESLADDTDVLFGESSSPRRPSVIEILAAIALGPMLAVSASDDRNMLTELEVSSLMELNELAMAELNAKKAEERRLGVIAEESFDSGNGDETKADAIRVTEEPDLLTSPSMVMKAIREIVGTKEKQSYEDVDNFEATGDGSIQKRGVISNEKDEETEKDSIVTAVQILETREVPENEGNDQVESETSVIIEKSPFTENPKLETATNITEARHNNEELTNLPSAGGTINTELFPDELNKSISENCSRKEEENKLSLEELRYTTQTTVDMENIIDPSAKNAGHPNTDSIEPVDDSIQVEEPNHTGSNTATTEESLNPSRDPMTDLEQAAKHEAIRNNLSEPCAEVNDARALKSTEAEVKKYPVDQTESAASNTEEAATEATPESTSSENPTDDKMQSREAVDTEARDQMDINSGELTEAITDGAESSSISNESLHTIGDSSESSDNQERDSVNNPYESNGETSISSLSEVQILKRKDAIQVTAESGKGEFILAPPIEFCDEEANKLADAAEVKFEQAHMTTTTNAQTAMKIPIAESNCEAQTVDIEDGSGMDSGAMDPNTSERQITTHNGGVCESELHTKEPTDIQPGDNNPSAVQGHNPDKSNTVETLQSKAEVEFPVERELTIKIPQEHAFIEAVTQKQNAGELIVEKRQPEASSIEATPSEQPDAHKAKESLLENPNEIPAVETTSSFEEEPAEAHVAGVEAVPSEVPAEVHNAGEHQPSTTQENPAIEAAPPDQPTESLVQEQPQAEAATIEAASLKLDLVAAKPEDSKFNTTEAIPALEAALIEQPKESIVAEEPHPETPEAEAVSTEAPKEQEPQPTTVQEIPAVEAALAEQPSKAILEGKVEPESPVFVAVPSEEPAEAPKGQEPQENTVHEMPANEAELVQQPEAPTAQETPANTAQDISADKAALVEQPAEAIVEGAPHPEPPVVESVQSEELVEAPKTQEPQANTAQEMPADEAALVEQPAEELVPEANQPEPPVVEAVPPKESSEAPKGQEPQAKAYPEIHADETALVEQPAGALLAEAPHTDPPVVEAFPREEPAEAPKGQEPQEKTAQETLADEAALVQQPAEELVPEANQHETPLAETDPPEELAEAPTAQEIPANTAQEIPADKAALVEQPAEALVEQAHHPEPPVVEAVPPEEPAEAPTAQETPAQEIPAIEEPLLEQPAEINTAEESQHEPPVVESVQSEQLAEDPKTQEPQEKIAQVTLADEAAIVQQPAEELVPEANQPEPPLVEAVPSEEPAEAPKEQEPQGKTAQEIPAEEASLVEQPAETVTVEESQTEGAVLEAVPPEQPAETAKAQELQANSNQEIPAVEAPLLEQPAETVTAEESQPEPPVVESVQSEELVEAPKTQEPQANTAQKIPAETLNAEEPQPESPVVEAVLAEAPKVQEPQPNTSEEIPSDEAALVEQPAEVLNAEDPLPELAVVEAVPYEVPAVAPKGQEPQANTSPEIHADETALVEQPAGALLAEAPHTDPPVVEAFPPEEPAEAPKGQKPQEKTAQETLGDKAALVQQPAEELIPEANQPEPPLAEADPPEELAETPTAQETPAQEIPAVEAPLLEQPAEINTAEESQTEPPVVESVPPEEPAEAPKGQEPQEKTAQETLGNEAPLVQQPAEELIPEANQPEPPLAEADPPEELAETPTAQETPANTAQEIPADEAALVEQPAEALVADAPHPGPPDVEEVPPEVPAEAHKGQEPLVNTAQEMPADEAAIVEQPAEELAPEANQPEPQVVEAFPPEEPAEAPKGQEPQEKTAQETLADKAAIVQQPCRRTCSEELVPEANQTETPLAETDPPEELAEAPTAQETPAQETPAVEAPLLEQPAEINTAEESQTEPPVVESVPPEEPAEAPKGQEPQEKTAQETLGDEAALVQQPAEELIPEANQPEPPLAEADPPEELAETPTADEAALVEQPAEALVEQAPHPEPPVVEAVPPEEHAEAPTAQETPAQEIPAVEAPLLEQPAEINTAEESQTEPPVVESVPPEEPAEAPKTQEPQANTAQEIPAETLNAEEPQAESPVVEAVLAEAPKVQEPQPNTSEEIPSDEAALVEQPAEVLNSEDPLPELAVVEAVPFEVPAEAPKGQEPQANTAQEMPADEAALVEKPAEALVAEEPQPESPVVEAVASEVPAEALKGQEPQVNKAQEMPADEAALVEQPAEVLNAGDPLPELPVVEAVQSEVPVEAPKAQEPQPNTSPEIHADETALVEQPAEELVTEAPHPEPPVAEAVPPEEPAEAPTAQETLDQEIPADEAALVEQPAEALAEQAPHPKPSVVEAVPPEVPAEAPKGQEPQAKASLEIHADETLLVEQPAQEIPSDEAGLAEQPAEALVEKTPQPEPGVVKAVQPKEATEAAKGQEPKEKTAQETPTDEAALVQQPAEELVPEENQPEPALNEAIQPEQLAEAPKPQEIQAKLAQEIPETEASLVEQLAETNTVEESQTEAAVLESVPPEEPAETAKAQELQANSAQEIPAETLNAEEPQPESPVVEAVLAEAPKVQESQPNASDEIPSDEAALVEQPAEILNAEDPLPELAVVEADPSEELAEAPKTQEPQANTAQEIPAEKLNAEESQAESPVVEAVLAEAPKVQEPQPNTSEEIPSDEAALVEQPAEVLNSEDPLPELAVVEAVPSEELAEAPKTKEPQANTAQEIPAETLHAEEPQAESPVVEAVLAEAPKVQEPQPNTSEGIPSDEAALVEQPAEVLNSEDPLPELAVVEAVPSEVPAEAPKGQEPQVNTAQEMPADEAALVEQPAEALVAEEPQPESPVVEAVASEVPAEALKGQEPQVNTAQEMPADEAALVEQPAGALVAEEPQPESVEQDPSEEPAEALKGQDPQPNTSEEIPSDEGALVEQPAEVLNSEDPLPELAVVEAVPSEELAEAPKTKEPQANTAQEIPAETLNAEEPQPESPVVEAVLAEAPKVEEWQANTSEEIPSDEAALVEQLAEVLNAEDPLPELAVVDAVPSEVPAEAPMGQEPQVNTAQEMPADEAALVEQPAEVLNAEDPLPELAVVEAVSSEVPAEAPKGQEPQVNTAQEMPADEAALVEQPAEALVAEEPQPESVEQDPSEEPAEALKGQDPQPNTSEEIPSDEGALVEQPAELLNAEDPLPELAVVEAVPSEVPPVASKGQEPHANTSPEIHADETAIVERPAEALVEKTPHTETPVVEALPPEEPAEAPTAQETPDQEISADEAALIEQPAEALVEQAPHPEPPVVEAVPPEVPAEALKGQEPQAKASPEIHADETALVEQPAGVLLAEAHHTDPPVVEAFPLEEPAEAPKGQEPQEKTAQETLADEAALVQQPAEELVPEANQPEPPLAEADPPEELAKAPTAQETPANTAQEIPADEAALIEQPAEALVEQAPHHEPPLVEAVPPEEPAEAPTAQETPVQEIPADEAALVEQPAEALVEQAPHPEPPVVEAVPPEVPAEAPKGQEPQVKASPEIHADETALVEQPAEELVPEKTQPEPSVVEAVPSVVPVDAPTAQEPQANTAQEIPSVEAGLAEQPAEALVEPQPGNPSSVEPCKQPTEVVHSAIVSEQPAETLKPDESKAKEPIVEVTQYEQPAEWLNADESHPDVSTEAGSQSAQIAGEPIVDEPLLEAATVEQPVEHTPATAHSFEAASSEEPVVALKTKKQQPEEVKSKEPQISTEVSAVESSVSEADADKSGADETKKAQVTETPNPDVNVNFTTTEDKESGIRIVTINDFTSQVSEAITEIVTETQEVPPVCSLSTTCKTITHPPLQSIESLSDSAQNPTEVYDEISHPTLENSREKCVPCLADELRIAAERTDATEPASVCVVPKTIACDSRCFTNDQPPSKAIVRDSAAVNQANAQNTPQGNHLSQIAPNSMQNSYAVQSQSSTTSLTTTTSTKRTKTKHSGSQFRKLTLLDRRFLAELEKRRRQRELIQNYLDTLDTIETPSYLTEDLYLESKCSIESSPYSLFSEPPSSDCCIRAATSTSRSAKMHFLNNILFSDRISSESNHTDDSTPTVIDTFNSSQRGSASDTDSGEEFSRDEATNRDSTTDTTTTVTTKTLPTNNVTNQSHINSPPPPPPVLRAESACSELQVVETRTSGGNEEHVDYDLMKHLVPGSIAEREYKKWYNAVDMPNNPYSAEALKRRLSGGPERVMDLPIISPSIEEKPITLGEDENKGIDDKNQERDYARYSRDYYINDAKHASGTTKKRSTPATTPLATTFIETPALPTSTPSSSSSIELEERSESTVETLRMSPVKFMCHKLEKQCRTEIEPDVYTAIPVRVEEDAAVESLEKKSNDVATVVPLTTEAVRKLSSETSSVATTESLTPSEDSDTIRIYDLKKQETRIIRDNQPSVPKTPVKKTRPTELDITPTIVVPVASTSSKSSTPTSFKFMQPKRKLIDPSQVLSIDMDTTPISPTTTTTTEKTVIEEDVVHALPSVKALAQAFLLTSSHETSKSPWRKARAKSATVLVKPSTPTQLVKPNTPTPIVTVTQRPPELSVADTSSHGSEDATIASDLSSLETDPPSKQDVNVSDTLSLARQSSQERPLSPVLVPGCLRNNIAFFENLKNK